jgi:hypothetical protein
MARKSIFIALLAAALGIAQTAATKTFATSEEARDALLQAAKGGTDALRALFGPGSEDIVRTGDPVQDKQLVDRFNARVAEKSELVPDPFNPDEVTLAIGNDDWPFAIPLVRKNGRWHWDIQEGKTEIRNRVVGQNELDAIDVCLGYVDAQYEYAEEDRTGKGVLQYASKLVSSPGKKDGLYWPGVDSPVAESVAKATAEGYPPPQGGGQPYHGYRFKVLTGQGASAYGGAKNYVIQGFMIGGFGLVAYPAEYGVSGIKTFIVNQDGVVYEKDLGPQTATLARAMTRFNPDKTWDESLSVP